MKELINFNNLYRVFAAVIITARSVTTALSRTSETSEAYESGRNVFSMIKDSNNSPLQQSEDKKLYIGIAMVPFCILSIH